jgi:hypothetical protein
MAIRHAAAAHVTDGRATERNRSLLARPGLLPKVGALAGLALLAACTSTQSQMTTGGQMFPRPQLVVVENFAVSPDEVQISEGLSAEVQQFLGSGGGTSRTEQELQTGHQVAEAISKNLVTEIRDLGLQAQVADLGNPRLSGERASNPVPPGIQNAVLITGQLVSVDEGNAAERVIIGFAAGRSDVRAQVQVFDISGGERRLMDTIEVSAKSGLTPGMAETMGAGALAGHLLVSAAVSTGVQVVSEKFADTVVADADRAAKGIAKQLSALFAQQGWTT